MTTIIAGTAEIIRRISQADPPPEAVCRAHAAILDTISPSLGR